MWSAFFSAIYTMHLLWSPQTTIYSKMIFWNYFNFEKLPSTKTHNVLITFWILLEFVVPMCKNASSGSHLTPLQLDRFTITLCFNLVIIWTKCTSNNFKLRHPLQSNCHVALLCLWFVLSADQQCFTVVILYGFADIDLDEFPCHRFITIYTTSCRNVWFFIANKDSENVLQQFKCFTEFEHA